MAHDAALLESISFQPTVHFYNWDRPSLTYGCLTSINHFFDEKILEKEGLSAAQRPTGGGLIFHETDLAFSVLIPKESFLYSENVDKNYALINGAVQKAVQPLLDSSIEISKAEGSSRPGFCMEKSTRFDLEYKGKKILGSALRLKKQGLLYQGSVACFKEPNWEALARILGERSPVLEGMKKNYILLPFSKEQAKEAIIKSLEELF